jgi:phosphohistidine phosphatase
MPELLLLRHAKSDRSQPEQPDRDRGLAPRGLKAAGRIGRLLRERGLMPDLVLCSSATRARMTWEIVAGQLEAPPPCRFLRSLYLATPAQMLALVRRQPASVRRLMLVGHDPGLRLLALQLAGSGEPEDLAALHAKFPTAAVAWLELAAAWPEVDRGRLAGFLSPRQLDG